MEGRLGERAHCYPGSGESMKPSDVKKLTLAAPVWVWIVWFGKGRWWPGTVERIETRYGLPLVEVRFESFSPGQHRTDAPVTVGLITAPMRRLELRDISLKGNDRPRFVPTSRLRKPEKPAPVNGLGIVEADSRISSESVGANGAHGGSVEKSSHGKETMSALLGKS
jgi:hypothetical protein